MLKTFSYLEKPIPFSSLLTEKCEIFSDCSRLIYPEKKNFAMEKKNIINQKMLKKKVKLFIRYTSHERLRFIHSQNITNRDPYKVHSLSCTLQNSDLRFFLNIIKIRMKFYFPLISQTPGPSIIFYSLQTAELGDLVK